MQQRDLVARIDRVALAAAAVVWFYLWLHFADQVGPDFRVVHAGADALLDGVPLYPETADPYDTSRPFYIHPPGSPITLAPLGLLSASVAGALFVTASIAIFLAGLLRLARRTPIPGLIVLAAGLSAPVQEVVGLGNLDALAAGLIALALTSRGCTRAGLAGAALAVKPTMWPILAVLGMEALGALAIVVVATIIGLAAIDKAGRFFDVVVPFPADGQEGVKAVRTSIPDAAVAAGMPRPLIAALSGAALLGLLAFVILRVPAAHRLAAAPLVVLATIVLSGYSFVPYCVYLIAVSPLLRPTDAQLPLFGAALVLAGAGDVWWSARLPSELNTALGFTVLAGLLLLVPVAVTTLRRGLGEPPRVT